MNEMRKLMETVRPLFDEFDEWDDIPVGFRNIAVGGDPEDIIINGEPEPVKMVWVYDRSDILSSQRGFSDDHTVTEEEYNTILNSVVDEVGEFVKAAIRGPRRYDQDEYQYEYVGVGAEISPEIDKRLIQDLISRTELANLTPVSVAGEFPVFKIKSKKQRWWSKR